MDQDTNDYVCRPSFLTVVLNETGEYSNIDSIAPLPEGLPITVPDPLGKLICFDMEPWNQAAFDALPEWAQEKIKKSTEWQKEHAPVTNVAVQNPGVAGFQNLQNIPGINLQAFMQQSAVQQAVPNPNTPNSGGGAPF